MDINQLEELLQEVKTGSCSIEDAMSRLRHMPFEDLGYAKLDHHRALRQGFPEVIFSQGKSDDQLRGILKSMLTRGHNIMATRAEPHVYEIFREQEPSAEYSRDGRIVTITKQDIKQAPGLIMVVSAGTSDIPVAAEAVVTARFLGNKVEEIYDVGVAGIHRLLAHGKKLSQADVLVVVAGMEGALASVVGGLVSVPIIAVPTSIGYGSSFGGLAALLAMLNSCANGVGVVNIDNGFGAACLASRINQSGREKEEETN
jgi:pyridinium-3,5-biscarboxylic acid mononucleotide synthase